MKKRTIKVKGINTGNVAGRDIVIQKAFINYSVCKCFFKKTEGCIVSVVESAVSQRELDLRVGVVIFALLAGVGFFGFLYPSWWQNSDIYYFASHISWAVAIACAVLVVIVLTNRQEVEEKIRMNILGLEHHSKKKEMV